ncbi:MAG: hypothetical protein CSA95_00325 [Bacteroidetes bacterium]|nr:MAG: hypothetical protein CSA95_00325 [Bacteroidota bacterium]
MLRNTLLLLLLFALTITIQAQDQDTMYIMKNGNVVAKYNVNTEIDSIIFYQPSPQPNNTFVDERDGTLYHFVTIGEQTWMAENLKYLPFVTDSTIISLNDPCCYVYGYGGTSVEEAKTLDTYRDYGVLYNWVCAMDGQSSTNGNPSGVQGICPEGWHLPSDAEWTELINFLGGSEVAGGKLKETGTTYWKSPNTGATNETAFGARAGGLHASLVGKYIDLKEFGYWWTTLQDQFFTDAAYVRLMWHTKAEATTQFYNKDYGFSVRCVRD